MAYVPVPKDLTKVKTKVAFNLTKRQLVCFGCGALIGVPLFFLLRGPAGNSVAAMCMMLVMLPFFMLAMYEKHGQPLEKIIGNILKVAVIRPKQRPYRTNNFYAVLERQANLDKEVYDNAFRANAGTDVVSDILFLQKRDRPLDIAPDWTQTGRTEEGFTVNQYFLDHPEMVLGRPTAESTQYGKQDYTVAPIEGLELADQLHDTVKYIRGTYQEAALPELG